MPGKDKTLWEGGLFKLDVLFPDGEIIPVRAERGVTDMGSEYPTKPPKCMSKFRHQIPLGSLIVM